MKQNKKINVLCAIVGLFVIIFDQAIKFSVLAFVPNGTHIAVCSNVNLVLTYNYGTSFGLLHLFDDCSHVFLHSFCYIRIYKITPNY